MYIKVGEYNALKLLFIFNLALSTANLQRALIETNNIMYTSGM